jgi:hypothetical protein
MGPLKYIIIMLVIYLYTKLFRELYSCVTEL